MLNENAVPPRANNQPDNNDNTLNNAYNSGETIFPININFPDNINMWINAVIVENPVECGTLCSADNNIFSIEGDKGNNSGTIVGNSNSFNDSVVPSWASNIPDSSDNTLNNEDNTHRNQFTEQ